MEYCECRTCGFVLRARPDSPEPAHWDRCPDCAGYAFQYTDSRSVQSIDR